MATKVDIPQIDRDVARGAFLDGYASATVAMPHRVYMDEGRRQTWLTTWAECELGPDLVARREDAIEAGTGGVA